MSSRYDDPSRPQSARRRVQDEQYYDDREAGRGLRQDVRETGRDIREAGTDILSSWCGIWGNLLISIGEVISSPTRPAGGSRQSSGSGDAHDTLSCGGAEYCVICNIPGAGTSRQQGAPPRTSDASGEGRTTARYADRDREIDVTT